MGDERVSLVSLMIRGIMSIFVKNWAIAAGWLVPLAGHAATKKTGSLKVAALASTPQPSGRPCASESSGQGDADRRRRAISCAHRGIGPAQKPQANRFVTLHRTLREATKKVWNL